jgi:hypothetical protein
MFKVAIRNHLNVYKGQSSMQDYFNPDIQPPLPLVELPEKLNPSRKEGVRIYAKMATALPAQNIKCLPGTVHPRLVDLRDYEMLTGPKHLTCYSTGH